MILLDPEKIIQFIIDVTNAHDKECLADIIKAPITGKTMLTESELETAELDIGYPQCKIIAYTVFHAGAKNLLFTVNPSFYVNVYTNVSRKINSLH